MPTDLELKEWIVNQLSSGRDPDDLILSICEVTGKPWKEAAALVQATQEHRSDEIVRRQSPILTVMAFSTFLGALSSWDTWPTRWSACWHGTRRDLPSRCTILCQ